MARVSEGEKEMMYFLTAHIVSAGAVGLAVWLVCKFC